jgi:formiminotetrahydrofolate cyclodeaminase
MQDQSATISAFLEATAAKQPTPGGGSVAALAGALAAAMGEMVVNYSLGKHSEPKAEGQLRHALDELKRARSLMLQLMAEDQAAYEALTAARKLPPSSGSEGPPLGQSRGGSATSDRQSRIDAALLACIRVPQALAATALAVLSLCNRIWEIANVHLLSDLAVCSELAMATVRCGVYNVRANFPALTDPADQRRFEEQTEKVLADAIAVIKRLGPRFRERHRMETKQ